MRFTKCDIAPLENLIVRAAGNLAGFQGWRGRHQRHDTDVIGPSSDDGTVRVSSGIRRASSARSGFSSSRCAFQFSTASPDKILSAQIIMDGVAPRGETA